MFQYFLEPKLSGNRMKVDLGLSNHAMKVDFKNPTGVSTSKYC